ncbi:MAG: Crp/Fnr family transcriptional regulator, partial [Gammaproteobacteria bacterium]|nr:Crp/Fnr family transcriptional regulator [Gammaproteobacteria bacterium]
MPTNRLLSNLCRSDQRQLLAACDEVNLCMGDVLWEPHKRIRHVYFPLDCFISQLLPVDSREHLELAL